MNTQKTQLIANDINEITLLVARAVKGHTAAGHTILAISIHQAPRSQWAANIAYTDLAPLSHPQPTAPSTPTTNGRGAGGEGRYIRLTDLAARCYYNHEHARKLCVELGIVLHRARGTGRPHCLSAADARRFAAEQCPGVRIDIDDALFTLDEDLPIAA